MKEHAESEGHIHACQIETSNATALLKVSIAQQLQQVQESERLKNRAAIKSLLCCTLFLAHNTLPTPLISAILVDLVMNCGGDNLKHFLEKAGKMLHTHPRMQWLTLLRQLVYGLRIVFSKDFVIHSILAC